jgi:hypothetical protein
VIRPLRQRHRRIVIALALIVPGLFVAALAARRVVPFTPEPQFEPTGGVRTNLITR